MRECGRAAVEKARRQQREPDAHPPCGRVMRRGEVAALNESVGDAGLVDQHREGRDHDENFEEAEIVRRKRAREHHHSADAQRLHDELRDHVVANRASERAPQPAVALGVLGSIADHRRAIVHSPSPRRRTGMVRNKILMSVVSDQSSRYWTSSLTISSKETWLRPLTCQRPVIPGIPSRRRRCQSW